MHSFQFVNGGPVNVGGAVGRIRRTGADTIVRPANVTAYAAGDVFASFEADYSGSMLGPITLAGENVVGVINAVRVVTNNTNVSSTLRLLFFQQALPRIVLDNDPFAMGAEIADFIGSIDVPINKLAGSWSWGQDTATNLPFDLNATGGPDQFLFVVPVILGAYTPVSGQTTYLQIWTEVGAPDTLLRGIPTDTYP